MLFNGKWHDFRLVKLLSGQVVPFLRQSSQVRAANDNFGYGTFCHQGTGCPKIHLPGFFGPGVLRFKNKVSPVAIAGRTGRRAGGRGPASSAGLSKRKNP